ncbi:MAG: NADH-quinone oxidoreductase subunit J [Proteobacteria bacterium]|nr:NADH-quinone oxidoreductase subunit J [Pseudomonadota bacterium]
MITSYITIIVGIVAVIAALSTVLQKNPVYSAVSLIVVMVALAVNYLLLNAEFIAVIQLIVYAGAIMVLFVFVIMLLNLGEVKKYKIEATSGRIAGAILTGLFFLQLVVAGFNVTANVPGIERFFIDTKGLDNTKIIGHALFSDYLLPFEVVSIVLIVGIIGAVVLGKKKE